MKTIRRDISEISVLKRDDMYTADQYLANRFLGKMEYWLGNPIVDDCG